MQKEVIVGTVRARRQAAEQRKLVTYQKVNGPSVLTPPKPGRLSTQAGMRSSLRGTRASREDESHTQDANVTEVSHGEPVSGEPEYPDNPQPTRR